MLKINNYFENTTFLFIYFTFLQLRFSQSFRFMFFHL